MFGKKTKNKSIISNLSVAFKKSLAPSEEEVIEVKKSHRSKLDILVEDFMYKVQAGEIDGIRNAKDLVEVMKMDLLLLGEATDRTEQVGSVDEIKVKKIVSKMNENDPFMKKIISDLMLDFNDLNDQLEDTET